MKTTIFLFCCASTLITVVSAQSNFYGEFLDAHNACQVDPATRIEGNLMDMAAAGEPVDETAFGNHVLCMYLRLGIMSRDGRINAQRTIDLLVDVLNDRPGVSRAVNRCAGLRRDHKIHRRIAAEYNICVNRNLPALETVTPPA